jgi:Mechanosensitive ion channel, conserved TM helix
MPTFLDPITDALKLTWDQLQVVSPRVFGALAFLILGWLVARTIRKLVLRLLRLLRLESAAERAGLEDFLMRGGVRFTTVTLIANLIYWGLMLVVAMAVFNILGVPVSTTLLDEIGAYLPNIMVALVIVVFGSMLARFIGATVHTYLNNIGVQGAKAIGFLAQIATLTFVATLAIQQLQIGGSVLTSAFQLAFGGLCLALALAFGLGGREWAAAIIQRTWKSR